MAVGLLLVQNKSFHPTDVHRVLSVASRNSMEKSDNKSPKSKSFFGSFTDVHTDMDIIHMEH